KKHLRLIVYQYNHTLPGAQEAMSLFNHSKNLPNERSQQWAEDKFSKFSSVALGCSCHLKYPLAVFRRGRKVDIGIVAGLNGSARPAGSTRRPSISAWRQANKLSKAASAMALIGKADCDRNLRERKIGVCKQLLGPPDTAVHQIVVRG